MKKILFIYLYLIIINSFLFSQSITTNIIGSTNLIIRTNFNAIQTNITNTISNITEESNLNFRRTFYTNKKKFIRAQTNIKLNREINKQNKSSKMSDILFFFLQKNSEFQNKFSASIDKNGNTYYKMANNSWNDTLYFSIRNDWKIFSFLKTRIGWGLDFCFGGSGNGSDSIKVERDTDLGKAHDDEFYAIYNAYRIPFYLHTKFQPFILYSIKFYCGFNSGLWLGFFTYNELIEAKRSTFEEQTEKSFITLKPMVQIYAGINFDILDYIKNLLFEISYRFTDEPILNNDLLPILGKEERRIKFQTAGLLIGIGLRY